MCPLQHAMEMIGGKWKISILCSLMMDGFRGLIMSRMEKGMFLIYKKEYSLRSTLFGSERSLGYNRAFLPICFTSRVKWVNRG